MKVKGITRIYRANQGWHEISGRKFYFKSDWEVKFAKFLQFLKEQKHIHEWEYEPQTFWFDEIKRGIRSYLPDFKIINLDATYYWVEVKGYMDRKSRTKIKRFKKYYPQEQLVVIDKEWFDKNGDKIPWKKE